MSTLNRREVLSAAIAGAATWSAIHLSRAQVASGEKLIFGVMGMGGRGTAHAVALAGLPNVHVKYVCDVDETRAASSAKTVASKLKEGAAPPQPLRNFQQILDDKEIHGVAMATPNHWHAPGAILAINAGKHVYVEKPCSHNPREGELLVEAAKKHNKMVQHGTQRRSWPKIIEGIDKVKSGVIGDVRLARCWYTATRGDIGKGKPAAPPAGLDWSLWQGPAPEKEFRDNYLHYKWHWFWHWGNGECGNNGVHGLDLGRWGLGAGAPKKTTSNGGRYYFDDDQETPDTQFVAFDYGDKLLTWEGKSCHPRGPEATSSGFGVAFYGTKATLVMDSSGYTVYDLKNKELEKVPGTGGDPGHFQNWLDAIRAGDASKLAAPITEGAASTLLCHLANIAHRTGKTVHLQDGKPTDADVIKLWSREYRPGWEPKV